MVLTLHRIFTWLVLAIGLVHTAGTFVFFGKLSEAAIWFAGAGLGAIFVAFLNMALWSRGLPARSRRLSAVSNVVFGLWLGAGFAATPAVPSAVVLGIGLAMVVSGLMLLRSGQFEPMQFGRGLE